MCPVVFTPSEVLEYLRLGKFTVFTFSGEIPASESVEITQTPMPINSESVASQYGIRVGWAILMERYDWGETSRPDEVYYELWNTGIPEGLKPKKKVARFLSGYSVGGKIKSADRDSRNTHIIASETMTVKLWNCSDPPKDVWYEFAGWLYTFPQEYLIDVLGIYRHHEKRNELLESILKKLGPAEGRRY